ncbi:hypothetical protein [Demequina soli]|uniref:hypothetical protein n=1 Tax=Demequina soli TaxID=1638987 RepID=UPI000780AC43|nr:hypothetical protein [Demequina soli]
MHTVRTRLAVGLAAALGLALAWAAPAAAGNGTEVQHGYVFSEYYEDDACSTEPNVTTYTVKTFHETFRPRADGSWTYHYLAVVTYATDYVSPAMEDVTGRLTEDVMYLLTPGQTFVHTGTFKDFYGDVKIHERGHFTLVDGVPRVEWDASVIDCG